MSTRRGQAARPDATVLAAARAQLEQANEKITIAIGILRGGGWTENANELNRTAGPLRVWTQADGWLDLLEGDGK